MRPTICRVARANNLTLSRTAAYWDPIGQFGFGLHEASRVGLAPTPTCLPGQGGGPVTRDDAAETAIKRVFRQHLRSIGRKMSLSVLPASEPDFTAAPALDRCPETASLHLFDVEVPVGLRQYGQKVRASALGSPAHPPVVVLGGISADCFPGVRPDGGAGWWPGLIGAGCAVDAV